jgi:hypothetical protein
MAAIRHSFQRGNRQKLADQRPIARWKPVIPFEIAEFDSEGLAGGRQ